jgi:hypothetical protein
MKREFTTNHTNITNKAGISDKKFVFFVWSYWWLNFLGLVT